MDRLEVAASGGASSLTEEAPDSLQSGAASRRSSFSYSTDEEGHGATAGATRDDVELWLVADVLDVQGLKAQLLPRFEALPQLDRYYNFKEESAAATLALCHHACALGCVKLAAALCVNLRVRVINNETSSMETMQEHIVPLYLAACLCDPPLQAQYGTILASLSAQEVSRMLDADTLRVESEDQVASFILRYIEERAWLSSAEQRRLWATCRFRYLSAALLNVIASAPNVPHDALAYQLMVQKGTDPSEFGVACGHRFSPRYTCEALLAPEPPLFRLGPEPPLGS